MFEEIYRDDSLVAVNKPEGLLCVPGLSSPDNLYDRVKKRYPNARVVHRLDMATSGLVLFALHYQAQKAISALFEKRAVSKHYRAIVNGPMLASAGEICLPLLCDWPNRPRQKVCWQQGKPALTRFVVETVDGDAGTSRVSLFPVTGRTHQLRVHMHALGHGILGDQLYLAARSQPKKPRLMLHAETLAFRHPLSGQTLKLTAECPF